jgi:hypothetical protein
MAKESQALYEHDGSGSDVSWQAKAMIAGGVVGALVGVGAAYLYIRNLEESGEAPRLVTKDAMTLGMTLVALVRQVASMGDKTG